MALAAGSMQQPGRLATRWARPLPSPASVAGLRSTPWRRCASSHLRARGRNAKNPDHPDVRRARAAGYLCAATHGALCPKYAGPRPQSPHRARCRSALCSASARRSRLRWGPYTHCRCNRRWRSARLPAALRSCPARPADVVRRFGFFTSSCFATRSDCRRAGDVGTAPGCWCNRR